MTGPAWLPLRQSGLSPCDDADSLIEQLVDRVLIEPLLKVHPQ